MPPSCPHFDLDECTVDLDPDGQPLPPLAPPHPTDVYQCGRCGTFRFRSWTRPFACTHCGCVGGECPAEGLRPAPKPHRVPYPIALALAAVDPVDEYGAAELLFQLRWADAWGCTRCGHRKATHLRCRPRLFECNACGHAVSVTAGTSLHRCRVPLVTVVRACWLLTWHPRSFSARGLAEVLGLAVETAWSLGHRLRSGFLAQRTRLHGEIALSTCVFRLRPPYHQKRPKDQYSATFRILWDRSLHVAVETGEPDHHALRRFVDRHADAEGALFGPVAFGANPQEIGNRTHHGVSDRWLPFYATSIAGWHNAPLDGQIEPVDMLRRVLATHSHPFHRLRPHAPPSRSLSTWRQGDRPLDVLRDWGRYPPTP